MARVCEAELRPILDGLDRDTPHCFGSDFGRIRDITVDWFLAIGRDLVRRTVLVLELREVPHEQQRQFLFYVCDHLPRLRAGKMDAGGNGSYLGEAAMQRYGEIIEPLQMTEPWYRENMPPWKAAIEDSMFTLPADREVLDDLRMVKLVRGVARIPDRRRTAEGEQRHGDAAIASVLAHAASRAEYEEIAYQAAPPRHLAPPARGWRSRPDDLDDDDTSRQPGWMPSLRGNAW